MPWETQRHKIDHLYFGSGGKILAGTPGIAIGRLHLMEKFLNSRGFYARNKQTGNSFRKQPYAKGEKMAVSEDLLANAIVKGVNNQFQQELDGLMQNPTVVPKRNFDLSYAFGHENGHEVRLGIGGQSGITKHEGKQPIRLEQKKPSGFYIAVQGRLDLEKLPEKEANEMVKELEKLSSASRQKIAEKADKKMLPALFAE